MMKILNIIFTIFFMPVILILSIFMGVKIVMLNMLAQLGEGMLVSAYVFFATLIISLPLGLVVALGRMSKNVVLRTVTKVYISIMRGTPLMLQLMVIFFAPSLIFGLNLSASYRYIAVIIGFGINYAAYFAEIYRGGIESIAKGQYEAAKVLGFTKAQTFFKIVLPQVVKRILPATGNEVITLVKDTSLARVLSCVELLKAAQDIVGLKAIIWPIFYIGAFYLLFTGVLTILFGLIEKKLNYYKG